MASAHDPYLALRTPAFRRFVISLMAMTVATQIRGVVVAWQLYAATGDPLALGLLGLAEALPFIAVALYAGHVADRVDRRRVALTALVVLLGCAGALLALSIRRSAIGPADVWPFYAVIFASGIARSFLMPARTALAAELVPRAQYANATAWRTSSWQFAAVVGPALGGVLYAVGGARLAYSVDVGLMLVAAAALLMVRRPPRAVPPPGPSIGESLSSGLRWVMAQPVVLGAMSLDLFSVLFGGAVALLPIFAADILLAGPQGLGALRAAPAVGSVLTALWLAHRPPLRRAGPALLWSVAAFGVTIIAFGLSRSFPASLAILAASGMADTVSVVIRATLLQVLTPDALLGRVSAVNAVFIGSSNEIGAFESGVAARLMGTVPSVVFGGCMTVLVVAITAWRNPALRRLRHLDGGAPVP